MKKSSKISVLILTLLLSTPAQARFSQTDGRALVFGFDVIFNGLKAGIGASYNGDEFWPAFAQGALAGTIVWGGEWIASHNAEIPFTGAAGKLVHDLGVSMGDNVMLGRPILSHYRTELAFIEFDIHQNVDINFIPSSMAGILVNVTQGNEFDFKNSLYNLTPVFAFSSSRSTGQRKSAAGYTIGNVVTYKSNAYSTSLVTLSHEFNHVLFNSEWRFIDDIIGRKSKFLGDKYQDSSLGKFINSCKIGDVLSVFILQVIPGLIAPKTAYYYSLNEILAYTMEASRWDRHPFYK